MYAISSIDLTQSPPSPSTTDLLRQVGNLPKIKLLGISQLMLTKAYSGKPKLYSVQMAVRCPCPSCPGLVHRGCAWADCETLLVRSALMPAWLLDGDALSCTSTALLSGWLSLSQEPTMVFAVCGHGV